MDNRSATGERSGGAKLLHGETSIFFEAQRLERCGKLVEAERVCRQLLSAAPQEARSLHLLGTIVHRLGRNDEAITLLERASAIDPQRFAYRANLAAVLGRAGRPEQALPHLEAAVRLRPDSPEAHNNLGAALEQLNRLAEAVDRFHRAITLRRAYPEAWYNLGNVLRKAGRLREAVSAYEEAARLKPDYFQALAHIPGLLAELGDAPGAIARCRSIVALWPMDPAPRSAMLYTLHYVPECDAASLAHEHREWGRLFCDPLKDKITPHDNDRSPERKLRVGYVSPDFREHTVPHFATAALEHHDREQFEVLCYSDVEKPDAVTAKLKGMVEHWRETRSLGNEGSRAGEHGRVLRHHRPVRHGLSHHRRSPGPAGPNRAVPHRDPGPAERLVLVLHGRRGRTRGAGATGAQERLHHLRLAQQDHQSLGAVRQALGEGARCGERIQAVLERGRCGRGRLCPQAAGILWHPLRAAGDHGQDPHPRGVPGPLSRDRPRLGHVAFQRDHHHL